MKTRILLPIGLALSGLSLIVVACSSSAATVAPSAAGLGSAAPSLALPSLNLPSLAVPSLALPSVPITAPSDSFAIPSFGSFAIPGFSFPSEDKDLEARLPSQLNGVPFAKYSFKGSTFFQSGSSGTQDIQDLLTALGKNANDLSIAFATDPNGALDVQIGAFRIAGADSGALLQAFIAATSKESPEDQFTQANVGGKNVTQIVDPTDTTTGAIYVYGNGDVLFYVLTPDQNLAAAALQALP